MDHGHQKLIGYAGTYTNGESIGIYRFTLDTEKGRVYDVQPAAQLGNPTYLTIDKGNQFLYSVVKQGDAGGVASFAINQHTGELEAINSEVLEGASPCHISVNGTNQNVVTANYHKGTIESFSTRQESGQIQPDPFVVQHHGGGPNKERQEKPHAHFAGFTPDEKYVVAVDLGIDKIITYSVDNGSLTEVNSLAVTAGSGPRHLVFHPNSRYAYVMTELSNEVIVLGYNADEGSFSMIQSVLAIPADFTQNSQGSAIHISADGKFIYAGNRGHDSIAVFSVSEESGELTFIEHTHTEGHWPRDFALDPTQKYIVASNQESGTLALFERDQLTGRLALLQRDIAVPDAVCVKFLNL
jgi:6-phosphogluconolactonase